MSFISGIEKKFEKHILETAVQQLGRNGHTGCASLGTLSYDYEKNIITMHPEQSVLQQVRAEWEKNHSE